MWAALSTMIHYILPLLVAATRASTVRRVSESDVTAILNEFATNDVNGGGEDEIGYSYQNKASHYVFNHDNAKGPLITSISDRILSGPTIKAFETLQALYAISDVRQEDSNTPERTEAADKFLDAVLATGVMKAAQDFLVKAGLSSADAKTFKQQLFELWFATYSRDGKVEGSSGFESAFVGETKDGGVVGLNYWYRFYLLEQSGEVNYHGWFTREKGVQLEIQFSWNDDHAVMDGILLGTSPEFELAAYTICALASTGVCKYKKNGKPVKLAVTTRKTADGLVAIDKVYPSGSGRMSTRTASGRTTARQPYSPSNLQKLVDAMWEVDDDKPKDYKINWGNRVLGTEDVSPYPMITYYNDTIFKKHQYQMLAAMYNAEVFVPDVCTPENPMNGFRKQYIKNVFDAFTNSAPFQLAFKYLQNAGKATDWASFQPKLWTLWLGAYSRCKSDRTILGSSGFEHVFSGEWKGKTVDGQHCWVKYYRHEKAGEINYNGYYSYEKQLTGTFQYTWGKRLKKTGGFNLGTSPAFDFSLFTVCALTHKGSKACKFNIMDIPMEVTSFTQDCAGGGSCLSTAYPSH